jgi:predicted amidophosphoribosyltransferase
MNQPPNLVGCPACAMWISPMAPMCPRCGHPMRTTSANRTSAQNELGSASTQLALGCLGVVVVLFVIVALASRCG